MSLLTVAQGGLRFLFPLGLHLLRLALQILCLGGSRQQNALGAVAGLAPASLQPSATWKPTWDTIYYVPK